jgi:hypothetical protein
VCIFCHTPHGGVSTGRGYVVPLWNKDLTLQEGATYTMYDSTSFDGDSSYDGGKPTGISLLCLSCHDGVATSEIQTVINYSPDGMPVMLEPNSIGELLNPPPYRNPNIGTNLSNDHPVSFNYNAALVTADTATRGSAGLNDPATVTSATPLRLFRDKTSSLNERLECATCHDPHEDGSLTGKAPFLRMSNGGSTMCTTCHIK